MDHVESRTWLISRSLHQYCYITPPPIFLPGSEARNPMTLVVINPSMPDDGSPRCITEGCGKERQWKGLCRSCYGQARGLLDKHKLTWDDLEAMGLIVADDKPFVAAFKRKLAEAKEKTESLEESEPEDRPSA